jgi:transcriptional regulator with XRE-family HTH domain
MKNSNSLTKLKEVQPIAIGLKIRKVREIKNIGQKYMADKLGISQGAYSDLENGKTKITAEKLDCIAKILEVSKEVIENFNDMIVLNSCSRHEYGDTDKISEMGKIQELYNKLLLEKDEQIETLKGLINELKRQRI